MRALRSAFAVTLALVLGLLVASPAPPSARALESDPRDFNPPVAPVSTGSASSARQGAPPAPVERVPVRSIPCAYAERLAIEALNARYAAIASESDRVVADAKAIRGLAPSTDLRWNHQAKDGGWLVYEAPAAVGTASR